MAPKSKSTGANGASKKPKSSEPSSTNGTATPATTTTDAPSELPALVVYGPGKPEKALYDSEQARIKAGIDAIQAKLSVIKDKLGSTGKGNGNDRRSALRLEMEGIRGQQSDLKTSRGKVFDQLKALQDGVQKKVKDLNAARAKVPYKTVQEIEDRVKQLEKQIESGNLKLVDEKKALAEVSQCKRSRRLVEGFEAEQKSIEADRAKADEIRKQLDDPEAKAISERYEAIKAELDELKREGDEVYANRSKLMDERSALQAQVDVLYDQKRESAQRFREANDKFWEKMNEDRARRAERARAERAAQEEAKRKELIDRLREEGSAPAFQAQIEDCQTLIEYFSGRSAGTPTLSADASVPKSDVVGVPKLELRQVEAAGEGLVVRKKKGDEESYFVGGGGKAKKGKKGGAKSSTPAETTTPDASGSQLHVPLPTLSALLSLSIPPPTSISDVPRLVEDLKIKKAWFEANQTRVTAENKAKAEADIKRLLGKSGTKTSEATPSAELTPPDGGAERPAESVPTSNAVDTPVEKLEVAEEQEAETGKDDE